MPAVHKSSPITLHHLSLLPSKKEVEWHHAAHSVSRDHTLCVWAVLALTTGHPPETFHFPAVSLRVRRVVPCDRGPFQRGQTEWPHCGLPGVLIRPAGGWAAALLHHSFTTDTDLLHTCFPTLWGKRTSAAGHMSDQRHSGVAGSHQCLLTAGWVMESRTNRWAPDRARIKRALSEKQDGGTQRHSREEKESRERQQQINNVKMLQK